MNKIKVKILQYGDLAESVDYEYIKNFKSSIFDVIDTATFLLPHIDNGIDYCTYFDEYWDKTIHAEKDVLTIVLTNVNLENHFFARHIGNSRIIFSFANIFTYFQDSHIRIENVILTTLYRYALIAHFKILQDGYRYDGLWHTATRGCLFDIDGNLTDVARTYKKPILCPTCYAELLKKGVSQQKLDATIKDLKRLKRNSYYDIVEWLQKHPFILCIISAIGAIIATVFSNLICEWIHTLG